MKLSKSTYIRGKSCAKFAYLAKQLPLMKPEIPPSLELKYLNGNEVGKLARDLYEGGVDISQGGNLFGYDLLEPTAKAISSGHKILYEAAFEADGSLLKYFNKTAYTGHLFFTADIVVICKDKIKVFEIKSSTKLKEPQHVYEFGFQSLVMRNCNSLKALGHGDKKIEFYFVCLNPDYRMGDELNINKLFKIENVTRRCLDVEILILEDLVDFKESFLLAKEPKERKGAHCVADGICPFFSTCWKTDVKNTILSIGGLTKWKINNLAANNILTLNKLSEKNEELTYNQWATLESNINGTIKRNLKELGRYSDKWNLDSHHHFINFEFFQPGVPRFPEMAPYQAIPFQLCTLSRKTSGGTIERTDFLETPGLDPRLNFLRAFLITTQQRGNIFYFDKGVRLNKKDAIFYYPKISILKKMAEQYPDYKEDLWERIDRMINISEPFEKRWYYDPNQLGSDEWNAIVRLFLDDFDLSTLPFGNAEAAKLNYVRYESLDLKNQILTRRALPEYCFHNTLALVNIVDRFYGDLNMRKAA